MNREKQIEEMAKDLGGTWVVDLEGNPHDLSEVLMDCDIENIAEQLYDQNYRKASDVAEEIFAEIEKKVKMSLVIHLEEIEKEHIKDTPLYDRHSGIIFALRQIEDYLAELKKKWTEGER